MQEGSTTFHRYVLVLHPVIRRLGEENRHVAEWDPLRASVGASVGLFNSIGDMGKELHSIDEIAPSPANGCEKEMTRYVRTTKGQAECRTVAAIRKCGRHT